MTSLYRKGLFARVFLKQGYMDGLSTEKPGRDGWIILREQWISLLVTGTKCEKSSRTIELIDRKRGRKSKLF